MKENLYSRIIGSGPDLVLLHGSAVHSGIWDHFAERLKKYYRLILIDMPGYGQSPYLKDCNNLDAIVQAVLEIVPDNAYWLGWSFGGLVALKAAMTASIKIEKLMTVACSPRYTLDTNWPGITEYLWEMLENWIEEEPQDASLFLLLGHPDSESTKNNHSALKEQLIKYADSSPAGLINSCRITRETDLRPLLSNLSCPTLMTFGEHDIVVSPSVIPELNRIAPHIQTSIIEEAAHLPFLTHIDIFLSRVIDFFGQADWQVNHTTEQI